MVYEVAHPARIPQRHGRRRATDLLDPRSRPTRPRSSSAYIDSWGRFFACPAFESGREALARLVPCDPSEVFDGFNVLAATPGEGGVAFTDERCLDDLSARSVRRVFAIFVKKSEVREWSLNLDDWLILDPSSHIEAPALVEPIPIRALLDSAAADDAVARALRAKHNPVIMALAAEGKAEGKHEGLVQGITALCDVLDIPLDTSRRSALQSLDTTALQSLLDTLRTTRRWPSATPHP